MELRSLGGIWRFFSTFSTLAFWFTVSGWLMSLTWTNRSWERAGTKIWKRLKNTPTVLPGCIIKYKNLEQSQEFEPSIKAKTFLQCCDPDWYSLFKLWWRQPRGPIKSNASNCLQKSPHYQNCNLCVIWSQYKSSCSRRPQTFLKDQRSTADRAERKRLWRSLKQGYAVKRIIQSFKITQNSGRPIVWQDGGFWHNWKLTNEEEETWGNLRTLHRRVTAI